MKSGLLSKNNMGDDGPYFPAIDDLQEMARPGALIPVYREILADLETPVSAYLKIASGGEYSFLLESVEGGEDRAHYSFVGGTPAAVARYGADAIFMTYADGRTEELSPDPLDLLNEISGRTVALSEDSLPPFIGGAVGFLGYECARHWERLPAPKNAGLPLPEAVIMLTDTLLVFDHLRHRAFALTTFDCANLSSEELRREHARACHRIDALIDSLGRPLPKSASLSLGVPNGELPETTCNLTRDEFLDSVSLAKTHIEAGDAIQVVISQRWSAPTDAEPFAIYRALRTVNPSPYMYFLQLGDLAVIGASPELLVQVRGREVAAHPIAGTRPRGRSPEEDAALEAELRADPKENAEHVMLVDLARNDVGRVSKPGSVRVTQLMDVERYSHVMHLTSHVTGVLRDGLRPTDAVRSCFPAGTVSGAPKIRAMELIAEIEPDGRGPYAGAVGYFSFGGNIDTAITIRTILMQDGIAHIQAGAGVVADSVPEREYEETRNKVGAMLSAINVAETLRDPTLSPARATPERGVGP